MAKLVFAAQQAVKLEWQSLALPSIKAFSELDTRQGLWLGSLNASPATTRQSQALALLYPPKISVPRP